MKEKGNIQITGERMPPFPVRQKNTMFIWSGTSTDEPAVLPVIWPICCMAITAFPIMISL